MRIVSGTAGGIEIEAPKGLSVRPTSIRARKALYDSIGSFDGKTVIDLFAGSGALGLEAASRGAARVVFVERSARHITFINANIQKVMKAGTVAEMTVIKGDASAPHVVKQLPEAPHMIFADPPYADSEMYFESLASGSELFSVASADTVLVWELPDKKDRSNDCSFFTGKNFWSLEKTRIFASVEFGFYRRINQ